MRRGGKIAIDILWIGIAILLLYMSLYWDLGIAFILGLFYFVATYAISGISSYGSGNPYKGMALSPQPNEIEYRTYKKEYDSRNTVKPVRRVNWVVLGTGTVTFLILLILLIIS